MAINDSFIYAIPNELVNQASTLITILKALGGAIIIYIIFSIINTIVNKNKTKKIDMIIHNLEEIKSLLSGLNPSQDYYGPSPPKI